MEKKIKNNNYLLPLLLLSLFFQFPLSDNTSHPHHFHKHFVFIHGSCHGAWSWFKLLPLLQSSGHRVTALDLAASGIDHRNPDSIRSISQYFQPLTDFMSALPQHQKVILVGHSLGGLAVAKAMEEFPTRISAAVFVTATMPGPALNISTIYGKDLTLATLLMRPVPLFTEKDMSDVLKLSERNYGSVKRVFVMSGMDLVSNKEFQRWMIENNSPDRVVEMEGSDHMVMMSKPFQLCAHLQLLAQYYP
ncbi:methylesterase 3-like isoform X1 [Cucumis melo var. makuwa]|uniref:Methylesterase 3-like isoform X1 n=1 Tax=Cucumis melo var. makuwa TaxID=1194695 RepID=A0A5D3C473_CUCMM|nr:methylesterase 3-like isoform X1 [Cucumis melo var. makuwa]TYK06723.1 methylesterase 3-like isoform X1 [Cucumis melo var. makuwa]